MRTYAPFADWPAVMAHARAGLPLSYQAPLDYAPHAIEYKAQKKTIRVKRAAVGESFTADAGHLDRFKRALLPVQEAIRAAHKDASARDHIPCIQRACGSAATLFECARCGAYAVLHDATQEPLAGGLEKACGK